MQALDRALARLARVNVTLLGAARVGALTLIGAMTVVILLQVFFRYVLGSALTWSEELARFMMVWMTFLVAPVAYRAGANVALDILIAHLRGRALAVLGILIHLLVLGFVLTFIYESLGLIERGLKMKASTLPVPMAVVYLILPASFALMTLVGLERIGRAVALLIDPARRLEPEHVRATTLRA